MRELTGTNRSFDLIALVAKARQTSSRPKDLKIRDRPKVRDGLKIRDRKPIENPFCFKNVLRRPGGPRRGDQTRSHPELGRQTPQRQWYFVSRHGRVGRRQACQERHSPLTTNPTRHRKQSERHEPTLSLSGSADCARSAAKTVTTQDGHNRPQTLPPPPPSTRDTNDEGHETSLDQEHQRRPKHQRRSKP